MAHRLPQCFWHQALVTLPMALVSLLGGCAVGIAAPEANFLRPPQSCPTDLGLLTAGLLRDLPSYANRVAIRSLGTQINQPYRFGSVLLAGAAEFEPIDLNNYGSATTPPEEAVRQVFFTTLERQYISQTEAVELQHYHWLFLVPDEAGWRMVLLFSSLGGYPTSLRAPTPPQESSEGVIGQAVWLWLRDCRAGAIDPIDPSAAGPSTTTPLEIPIRESLDSPGPLSPNPATPPASAPLDPEDTGR